MSYIYELITNLVFIFQSAKKNPKCEISFEVTGGIGKIQKDYIDKVFRKNLTVMRAHPDGKMPEIQKCIDNIESENINSLLSDIQLLK